MIIKLMDLVVPSIRKGGVDTVFVMVRDRGSFPPSSPIVLNYEHLIWRING